MTTYIKKHPKAFVIFLLIGVVAGVFIGFVLPTPAKAAGEKYPAKTFILPYQGESYKTIVLYNRSNATLINATTGAATTTHSEAELAGVRETNGGDWTFTIPATNIANIYLKRFDVAPASIDKDTVYTSGNEPLLYNPTSGLAYTDTNPVVGNQVSTSAVNYD